MSGPSDRGSVVDCHVHGLPGWVMGAFRRWLAETNETSEGPHHLWSHAGWSDPADQLQSMDRHAIGTALVIQSSNAPAALHAGAVAERIDGPSVIRRANADLAAWAQASGSRLLAVPWIDPRLVGSALDEINRAAEGPVPAVSTLCAHQTPAGVRFLDHPEFQPVLAAASEAGVTLFLHPSGRYPVADPALGPLEGMGNECLKGGLDMVVEATLGLARLVLSGAFDRHERLRVVTGQLGGVFPFVLGRFDLIRSLLDRAQRASGENGAPAGSQGALRNMREYTDRIFVDTHSMDRAALECALEVLGPSQVLFGSDFPVTPEPLGRGQGLDLLEEASFGRATTDAIRGANARSLIGLAEAVAA